MVKVEREYLGSVYRSGSINATMAFIFSKHPISFYQFFQFSPLLFTKRKQTSYGICLLKSGHVKALLQSALGSSNARRPSPYHCNPLLATLFEKENGSC